MVLVGLALIGCKAPEENVPTPEIPTDTAESELPWDDTDVFRPDNTGSVALGNDVPLHNVIIEQAGVWNLSGNPYDVLIGTFTVRELIDGVAPGTADTAQLLECEATYSLVGTPAPGPTGCPSCDHVWDIQFTLSPTSETDASLCNDPDLPDDGDTWRMGFASGSATIFFNFYGTGVYVPWWGAVASGDSVIFEWTRELAIDIPEPEDN